MVRFNTDHAAPQRRKRSGGGGSNPKFTVAPIRETEGDSQPVGSVITPDRLSPDQAKAFDQVMRWYTDGSYGVGFYITLGGLAGTGKTTLISVLANELSGRPNPFGESTRIRFAAFTGKAASVLRRKLQQAGIKEPVVNTLHSLLYRPKVHQCTKDCKKHCRMVGEVDGWELKPSLGCDLVVVDEASMLSVQLWDDLKSFNIPVLAVGDHGQLPPIGDNPKLMENPVIRLEQIHRQAADNPIIQLAHHVRQGANWRQSGIPADARLTMHRGVPDALDALGAIDPLDLGIICGRNDTRVRVNNLVRQRRGADGPAPDPGDVLIALRNFPPVFNGLRGQFVSASDYQMDEFGKFEAVVDLPDDNLRITGGINFHQFGRPKTFAAARDVPSERTPSNWRQAGLLFDYGFGITCHKAQGSQFEAAIVVTSDVFGNSDVRKRWLYTAVTRAAEKLILV